MDRPNLLHIKNMVCPRCIMAVEKLLTDFGYAPLHVELGLAVLSKPLAEESKKELQAAFAAIGFELLDDKRLQKVEQIKTCVIEWVRSASIVRQKKLSDYLVDKCRSDYSALSKLFSEVKGITIEKYCIVQKIERVKELLKYDELTVSQIANEVGYSSVAHLSSQFRQITGLTPSQFKQSGQQSLQSIDNL